MNTQIDVFVLDFYDSLFERIFTHPFQRPIPDLRKRKAIARQVEESADSSSQVLQRFLLHSELSKRQVEDLFDQFSGLKKKIRIRNLARSSKKTESLQEEFLPSLPAPESFATEKERAAYRMALFHVLQSLMLIGPLMAEWQKLNFSSTFELIKRVNQKLDEISQDLQGVATLGKRVKGNSYELTYRDYLLQRFYRIEAGTVKITTDLHVDLNMLFVEPQVKILPVLPPRKEGEHFNDLMALESARFLFQGNQGQEFQGNQGQELEKQAKGENQEQRQSFQKQVEQSSRLVMIGAPGSGKSTALEWLQLRLAARENANLPYLPLLLRLRQLDLQNLPQGKDLIEAVTSSRDQADLMPEGWIEEKMRAGKVLPFFH